MLLIIHCVVLDRINALEYHLETNYILIASITNHNVKSQLQLRNWPTRNLPIEMIVEERDASTTKLPINKTHKKTEIKYKMLWIV